MGHDYDLKQSYAWFKIAAENGHENAENSMKQIEAELTAEEIVEVNQLVLQLEKKIKKQS